jgi:hypothetical protein
MTTPAGLQDLLLRSPESSPVSHSPKIAPIDPVADDGGVFMLEDDDGEDVDEEEVPEESSGRHADMCVDFGLSMTEYDPEEYVPANRRFSFDADSPKRAAGLPPSPGKQEEFLATSFTGSPRLQSALQSLHQQSKSRSRASSDAIPAMLLPGPAAGGAAAEATRDRFAGVGGPVRA